MTVISRQSSPLKLLIAGGSDPGKHRQINEDAYALLPAKMAAVLADGMGGLARGDLASRLVVEAVVEAIESGESPDHGLRLAHQRIGDASLSGKQERMGSTAVVLNIEGAQATIRWVGDSRAYLWRAGSLTQLTKDHSFVNELIDVGAISVHEAEVHPNRNVLTRAVGVRDVNLRIDSVTFSLHAGDRLLLSSDGLHGFLPQDLLTHCLQHSEDAGVMVRQLIQSTLRETEAEDNVTVVCVFVES